jgi:hypothetical protein
MPGMANIARDVPDYFDLTQNLGGTRARIGCVRIPVHDLQPEWPGWLRNSNIVRN